jgi:hypothetical protein
MIFLLPVLMQLLPVPSLTDLFPAGQKNTEAGQ